MVRGSTVGQTMNVSNELSNTKIESIMSYDEFHCDHISMRKDVHIP